MHWHEVQSYFHDLIGRARRQNGTSVDTELNSMRFASMCVALGLDPSEGRDRILDVINGKPKGARKAG